MAPVEGRAASMHTRAGAVRQYRRACKLADFIISRTTRQDLFCKSHTASNHRTESLPNSGIAHTSCKLDVGHPALASSFCVSHLATDLVCHPEESEKSLFCLSSCATPNAVRGSRRTPIAARNHDAAARHNNQAGIAGDHRVPSTPRPVTTATGLVA